MDDGYDENIWNTKIPKLDEDLKKRIAYESFQLSENRLHLIFEPDGEEKVSIRAYDTVGGNDITAAHILVQGIISTLEDDYEYIMQLGHEATIKRLESVSQHERNKSITVDNQAFFKKFTKMLLKLNLIGITNA